MFRYNNTIHKIQLFRSSSGTADGLRSLNCEVNGFLKKLHDDDQHVYEIKNIDHKLHAHMSEVMIEYLVMDK